MPIPEPVKNTNEQDIVTNFTTVDVPIPEASFGTDATFDAIIAHPDLWEEDQTREAATTKVGIFISYPQEDFARHKFSGNLMGERKQYTKNFYRTDEVTSSTTLVNDANPLEIDFQVDEPNVGYMEVYTSKALSPTSKMRLKLLNAYDEVLAVAWGNNLAIVNGGWTRLNIGLPFVRVVPGTGYTATLTLRIECVETGGTPVGFEVHKNAGGEYLIRAYTFNISKIYGSINEHRMRFEIYSKHKERGDSPESTYFLGHSQIVNSTAEQIREYILGNWRHIGSGVSFRRIEASSELTEYLASDWYAKTSFDVVFLCEQVGTESEIVIKSMDIAGIEKV